MSLFLVGNVNADKRGKYGYVSVTADFDTMQPIWFAQYYKTLNECRDALISYMKYDSKNGYRTELEQSNDLYQYLNYGKNERKPESITYCALIVKD